MTKELPPKKNVEARAIARAVREQPQFKPTTIANKRGKGPYKRKPKHG